MNDLRERPPLFRIQISEVLIVIGIISALCALLLPAVHQAKDSSGRYPVTIPSELHFSEYLHSFCLTAPGTFWLALPPSVVLIFSALILSIRRLLPARCRKYFVWRIPKDSLVVQPKGHLRRTSVPAWLVVAASICSSLVLCVVASHFRVQRTQRRPVVIWEGAFAETIVYFAWGAWCVSTLAFIAGIVVHQKFRSRPAGLGIIGSFIGFQNLYLSLVLYCGATED